MPVYHKFKAILRYGLWIYNSIYLFQ